MTRRRSLVLGSLRERGTLVVTAALAGFYSAFMLLSSQILGAMAGNHKGTVSFMLSIVASVFIAIALYVSAIVIAGSVATVIAGRLRHIATLRLLGADARGLRSRVIREVATSTLIGAAFGSITGTAFTDIGRWVLEAHHVLPHRAYPFLTLWVVPALLVVVLVSALAGGLGSKRVLTVSPATAMSGVPQAELGRTNRLRGLLSALLCVPGALLMALACWLGEKGSGAGMLTAFVGGAVFVLGIVAGAPLTVPRLVRALGYLLGSCPSAVIARRNAVADPMRTSRSTLGLVIGTGLVTTFASGTDALSRAIDTWDLTPRDRASALNVLHTASIIMMSLVVIASVIAAVGFVSTMSLVVLQRRREIGMLRAMGFTARQIRGMVSRESLALGLTAVIFGMGLGVVFGSVGAQSLIGIGTDGFVWGVPTPVLAVISGSALVLMLLAALPPARRATRMTPVEALRVL